MCPFFFASFPRASCSTIPNNNEIHQKKKKKKTPPAHTRFLQEYSFSFFFFLSRDLFFSLIRECVERGRLIIESDANLYVPDFLFLDERCAHSSLPRFRVPLAPRSRTTTKSTKKKKKKKRPQHTHASCRNILFPFSF